MLLMTDEISQLAQAPVLLYSGYAIVGSLSYWMATVTIKEGGATGFYLVGQCKGLYTMLADFFLFKMKFVSSFD